MLFAVCVCVTIKINNLFWFRDHTKATYQLLGVVRTVDVDVVQGILLSKTKTLADGAQALGPKGALGVDEKHFTAAIPFLTRRLERKLSCDTLCVGGFFFKKKKKKKNGSRV